MIWQFIDRMDQDFQEIYRQFWSILDGNGFADAINIATSICNSYGVQISKERLAGGGLTPLTIAKNAFRSIEHVPGVRAILNYIEDLDNNYSVDQLLRVTDDIVDTYGLDLTAEQEQAVVNDYPWLIERFRLNYVLGASGKKGEHEWIFAKVLKFRHRAINSMLDLTLNDMLCVGV